MNYIGKWTNKVKDNSGTNNSGEKTDILDVIEVDEASGIVRAVGKNLTLNELLANYEQLGDPFALTPLNIPRDAFSKESLKPKEDTKTEEVFVEEPIENKLKTLFESIGYDRVLEILRDFYGVDYTTQEKTQASYTTSDEHELIHSIIKRISGFSGEDDFGNEDTINIPFYIPFELNKLFKLCNDMNINEGYVIDVITQHIMDNSKDFHTIRKFVLSAMHTNR